MAYNKKAHLRDNIEAIRLMFRLEKEQRTATPEEAGILAAYSGFGGIKAVLSPFGKLTDILRWTQADRELFPLITELHNVLRDGAADEREYKRLVGKREGIHLHRFLHATGHYRRYCFFFGRTRGIARAVSSILHREPAILFQPSNRNATPHPATRRKWSPMKRIC